MDKRHRSRSAHSLLALVALLIASSAAGCARVPATAPRGTAGLPQHIGPFTVREVRLPAAAVAQAFPRGGAVLVGPHSLLRVTASRPYTVFRQRLDGTAVTAVARPGCAQPPFFAQSLGPDAVLVCAGPVDGRGNRLILLGARGPARGVPIAARIPVPISQVVVSTEQYDGSEGDLLWSVTRNGEPPTPYGSGVVDLATGRAVTLPEALAPLRTYDPQASIVFGRDDTLYELWHPPSPTLGIFRWGQPGGAWTAVGWVPYVQSYGEPAVGSDGSLWLAAIARPSATLVEDWWVEHLTPGQRPQRWPVRGDLLGVGPGYYAYAPQSDPGALVLRFPLQGKSLTYRNLSPVDAPPYMLTGPAVWDPGWSEVLGLQVILLGTSRGVRELIVSQ